MGGDEAAEEAEAFETTLTSMSCSLASPFGVTIFTMAGCDKSTSSACVANVEGGTSGVAS